MDNKWIKDHWFVILSIGVFLVLGVPFLLNWAFKSDWGIKVLQAEWDAGDALTYYGCILAAVLAAGGVYFSIKYTQDNYYDSLRNNVLPFFSVYNLKTKSKTVWKFGNGDLHSNEVTDNKLPDKKGYQEYKITDYWFILENGKIEIKDGPTKEQEELLDNSGFKWIINNGVASLVESNHICHPLEIENVGNGAAISFRLGFNKVSCDKPQHTYGIPVKAGEKIMVHIFSDDCGPDSPNLGKYVLELHYKDIYGNKYSQKHEIEISYSNQDRSPVFSIKYEEEQVKEP